MFHRSVKAPHASEHWSVKTSENDIGSDFEWFVKRSEKDSQMFSRPDCRFLLAVCVCVCVCFHGLIAACLLAVLEGPKLHGIRVGDTFRDVGRLDHDSER